MPEWITASGGEVYGEDAFRFFLAHERKRAERTGRSLLLVLVELAGSGAPDSTLIDEHAAETLFDVLAECVRDSDFIGWHDAHRRAGAVLVQGSDGPGPEVSTQVGNRVAALLDKRLPRRLRHRLEVRVLQLDGKSERGHA